MTTTAYHHPKIQEKSSMLTFTNVKEKFEASHAHIPYSMKTESLNTCLVKLQLDG